MNKTLKYLPLLLLLIPAIIIPTFANNPTNDYAVPTPTNVHAEPSMIEKPGYFKVTWNHTPADNIPVHYLVDVEIRPYKTDKIIMQVESTSHEAFVSMEGIYELDEVEVYVMAVQSQRPYLTSGYGYYWFMLCQTSLNERGAAC